MITFLVIKSILFRYAIVLALMHGWFNLKTVKQSLELMHGRTFFNSRYLFVLYLRRRTERKFKKKFQ